MATPLSSSYARYEQALEALCAIPDRLKREMNGVNQAQLEVLANIAQDAEAERDRLAKLRRTAVSRYRGAAEQLKLYGHPLPTEIRPEVGQAGDMTALTAGLRAQADAVAAAERAIQQTKYAGALQQQEHAAQKAAAVQAADALRLRQENTRRARAEAATEAKRQLLAEEARARMKRQIILLISGCVAAAVVIAIVITVILS